MNANPIGVHLSGLFGQSKNQAQRFTGAFTSVFSSAKPTPLGSLTTPTSWTRPLLVLMVVVLISVIAIFMGVKWGKESGKGITLLTDPLDLYAPKSPVILGRDTTSTMSGTYTLSFYLRVDAAPDMREATPLFTWPGVWSLNYSPAQEELLWTFQQTRESVDSTTIPLPDSFVLPGVPLQRWTQIAMVFEGRSVDLFVNGALIQSRMLSNVPPSASASLTLIPGNLIGSLAFVQVWPNRQSISTLAANYTATSDSQGRPLIPSGVFASLKNLQWPNLFCPSGTCCNTAKAPLSQKWSFPYA